MNVGGSILVQQFQLVINPSKNSLCLAKITRPVTPRGRERSRTSSEGTKGVVAFTLLNSLEDRLRKRKKLHAKAVSV